MINAVSTGHIHGAWTPIDRAEQVDFLRLLTIQLQHQDPLNPVDEREFLTQMAQFSALTELRGIRDAIQDPQWQWATLIGKHVTIAGPEGPLHGEVSSVLLEGTPHVVVNQKAYAVEWIIAVHNNHD